jgi:hypothetical protein
MIELRCIIETLKLKGAAKGMRGTISWRYVFFPNEIIPNEIIPNEIFPNYIFPLTVHKVREFP